MRIIYHHRTLGDGAEGIHIREMVNALRELGHDVRVVSLVGEPDPTSNNTAESPKSKKWELIKRFIPEVAYELAELGYNVVGTRMLVKAIREFQPHFLYERYNSYNKAGLKATRKTGIPFILEVNAPVAYERTHYSYLQMKFPWLAKYYEKVICSNADHVFTVSTALKEFLIKERGVLQKNITVTPNAINPEKYKHIPSPEIVRTRFNLDRQLVVGFIGSLREWHGVDILMDIIPEVLSKHSGCYFMIVGRGELEEKFRQFIKDQGLDNRVVLTGWVPHDEIPQYISAMDITLMPNSNFYGSPMKVFEYMAVGKATIAPRLGPLQEVIEEGVNGILVEPGNAKELSRAILDLLNNPEKRSKIGENARKHILTNFSWKRNAEKVVQVYEQIVKKKSKTRKR
ncbi:MAG: glycosyltransferase family 1 protein [Ignavibacteria bacterium]|nr:MAG: glycosyltransferase family 1 protein [Ignavibacteria bacterium]